MAAPVRFLSGRQQQQKIGIEGSTQDEKVLEVVGRVGIGTTIFESSKQLDVRGDVIVSGELTVGDTTFGTDITTRNLSASGIATLGTVEVSSGIITAVSGVVTYFGDGSQLTNLPSSGLNEIREEGSVVGTTIESLNFVGNNITVSAAGTASTITSSDTPTFDTLDVTGHTELDDVNVSGAITATTFTGNLAGTVNTAAQPNITSLGTLSSLTVSGAIDANGNLDVDGHTELDDVNVSGAITATTFTGNLAGTVNTAAQPNITSVGTLTELEVTGITSSSAFADFDYLQAPFGSTVTFDVTVVSKDSSHRYNGTGSGFGYSINGVQAPFLTLTPGRTYRFNLSSSDQSSHPFRFYLEADKTTQYTTNVTTASTYTEITITDETPVVLHYQCSAHGYMGNAVQTNSNVVNTNYAATLRGGLDVTGHTELDNLNVSGVSTFAGAADFNGNVDIDGHTELDNLNVSGVSTFVGLVTVTTGDVHIAQRLFVGGLEVEGSGSENTFTGINTFTNLLDNTLGDPDTGALNVNGGFGVNKNVSFGSTLFVQNAIGIGSSAPIGKLDVNGHTELDDVNVSGAITATTFTGNLAGTVNTAAQPNITSLGTLSSLTVSGTIDANGNLDVDGQTELDDLNVSGVSTFQSDIHLGDNDKINMGDGDDLQIFHHSNGTGIIQNAGSGQLQIRSDEIRLLNQATDEDYAFFRNDGAVELYYDNSKKFETTGIGVSIVNGTSDTATITGPSNLVIDPAAVGDNTGTVRIKGDLFVDGTQTQINSTTIELADFIVGIASTATTDTLADGAGIQIGPDNTFLYEYNGGTNPSLKSSENLNVASGKGYQINQTEVLSATTLGSSVVNSSLTSVGTLGSLTVSGNITANGNIVGDNSTNITGIDGVTATTLTGTPANTNSNSAFSVTANGSSAYRFTGPGNSGSDDNPDLYLVRGQRYTFTNNSGGSHPFQIRESSGGSAYNDGVTNNGASSGNIVFNVQYDAPARLYYQCTSHGGMVGTIYIVGGQQIISGIVTATAFSGSGASLTALNASNLASGTIPDARFPATLPAISGANLTNLPAATTIPVADESSDTTCFPVFTTAATGSLALKSGSNLTFNSANGTLTATAFSGDGSALTNLSNVLDSVVSDTSPQLGANLDLNGNLINGTGGINITGIITATTFSGSGASLDTLNASNLASGTIPDGRFPATLPAVSGANLTAVDAATLDGVDSTSFLRSDASDTFSGSNLTFDDSSTFRLGTGGDLRLYHNGSHSFIEQVGTGDLRIISQVDDGDVVIQSDNSSGGLANYFRADGSTGEVVLYHYGSEKLATKSGGVTVTGTLTATTFSGSGASLTGVDAATLDGVDSTSFLRSDAQDNKTSGHLIFNDSVEAKFGTDGDLRILHDSNGSWISQEGSGYLTIRNTTNDADVVIQSDNGSGGLGNYFRANGSNGEAVLYYYGSQKLATKSTGIDVTGAITADGLRMNDNETAEFGTSNDMEMYHDGSNSYINNNTGSLYIRGANGNHVRIQARSGEESIVAAANGSVELYYDNSKKLETTSGGATITGTLTATTFSGSGASLTAVDAATLDGVDSTSFLRSDAADNKTSGDLTFYDGVKARFGTDGELNVYHESNYSYILNSTVGDIIIRNEVDDADTVIQGDNGSGGNTPYFRADGSTGEAMLYHYGTEKLATKSGGVTVTGTLTATAFSGDGSALTNLPASTPDKISEGNTEVEVIDTGSDGHVKFTTEGSERARIDASGRLGIGVTTPGSTLEINVGTATSAFDIQGSAGQLFSVTNNLTSGSIFSVNDVSGIPSIDVDADGTIQLAPFSTTEFVGIGTTNPTSKLHVVGDARVTGISTFENDLNVGSELVVQQGDTSDIQYRSFYNNNLYAQDVARFAQVQGYPSVAVFANYFNNDAFGTEVSIIRSLSGDIGNNNGGGGSFATPGRAIGGIKFGASISNQIVQAGFFGAFVSESGTFSDTSKPTDFRFYTNPNGAIVPTEKVRITSEGNVGIGSTIPTSKLDVVGDARVTGVITATSFSGSGANLTGISADVVDDTTPQLGGDLNTNGNLIQFPDSGSSSANRATFGDASDLSIYHDGSNSYIVDSGTGNLIINATDLSFKNAANNATYLTATDGGAVTLYHNNVYKFQTKSDGVNVVGELECDSLDVSGGSTFNDTVHLPANVQLRFDSNNTIDSLRIYDDGSDSRFISDHSIFFGTDGVWAVLNESQNSYKIRANSSNVLLYHSGSTKFETTSTGVDVTGTITADGLDMEDSQKILLGTGDDLEIYHDGTNNIIKTAGNQNLQLYSLGTGAVEVVSDAPKLIFNDATGGSQIDFSINANTGVFTMEDDTNSDTFFKYTQNGAVELYHDNSKKLETTADGAIVTGILTATSFAGDGSALTGISAGGSPEFYTGITGSTQITPLSFETSVFTFPSTSGRQYVIESISVANVDESVGVGTTVNIIASIEDATAAEQTYIAYNVPIVTGGLIELLKNPIVAGPSDVIKMWTTNDGYTGVSNAADVYINYTEFESTDYISKFASSTTINSTSAVTLYTSTGNPTMIEKIGFANRTDTGDFPVSIKITNGVTTSYLAKNLIIPRYSTVDILDRHKRIETGAKIEVEVGSTNTVDVIISGKKITS